MNSHSGFSSIAVIRIVQLIDGGRTQGHALIHPVYPNRMFANLCCKNIKSVYDSSKISVTICNTDLAQDILHGS